jgi:hypothetical protein
MSMVLPTLLTVTKFRAPGSDEPQRHETPALHARLADALLGDALLGVDDLGPGWAEVDASSQSLFTGTAYGGLAIADVRRAFVRASDGARVEQQIAVLPRWTLRHLSDDFAEGETPADVAAPVSVVQSASGARAMVAPSLRRSAPRRPAGVVRHGAVVMALRFASPWSAEAPAEIAAAADIKCAEIAEILR